MKAIIYSEYGSPDNLRLAEVETPAAPDGGVLVRVRAASVNPLDWHLMRGTPYVARPVMGVRRPRQGRLGADVAGHVEAIGKDVTRFKPGDEVFGTCDGAFAEFAPSSEAELVPKPAGLSFEQAAALPVAGFAALKAVRDVGQLQFGQRILVNGASGGVGTLAVQIAKAFGGDVTGVCSTKNGDLVRSLGATRAIDYTREDFTRDSQRYDLLIDLVGNRSLSDLRRVVTSRGTLVLAGGGGGAWLGPLGLMLKALALSPFVRHRLRPFMARPNNEDLATLAAMTEAGKLAPVIDRTYPFEEAADAIRYVEAGHARGKVVVALKAA